MEFPRSARSKTGSQSLFCSGSPNLGLANTLKAAASNYLQQIASSKWLSTGRVDVFSRVNLQQHGVKGNFCVF